MEKVIKLEATIEIEEIDQNLCSLCCVFLQEDKYQDECRLFYQNLDRNVSDQAIRCNECLEAPEVTEDDDAAY